MKAATTKQTQKQRRSLKGSSFLLFVLVPLLSLVAIQPILTGILPWRGDGLLHFVRLAELERAVRAGVLFPRWLPDLGYGFGFPLFHYYAPFSYYVGLIPRVLGFSLPVSMVVSYVLALWVLGWGVALWARDVWRDWLGVITAVLASLYAPYILYNVYHRAALAELWGLAWLVLVLWAVNRVFRKWKLEVGDLSRVELQSSISDLILIGVFYALLILSHNITAMIGTPLILGYALLLLLSKRPLSFQSLVFILLGLFLGLGLSAFFWLPAFFERNLVQIENLTATSGFTYVNHFLNWTDILARSQTADPQLVNPNIPRSLSLPVVGLALLAWLPMKRLEIRDQRLEIVKVQRLGMTVAALLCVFMVLPWSQPLWEAVELLSFVQFPWRFLGPASIFFAMLAGLGTMQLWSLVNGIWSKKSVLIAYGILVTSVIVFFALSWLFPSRAHTLPDDISASDTIQFEVDTGWLGTTAAADYLPQDVQILPLPDAARSGLAASELPVELAVQDLVSDFTSIRFKYELDEPTTAVFHQFFFPGWQAALDGSPLNLEPSDPGGLITAVLPASGHSSEHSFELSFGNTPLRTMANVISIISLVILLGLMAYSVIHKLPPVHKAQSTNHNSLFIISAILIVLVIFGTKTLLLDHINSPFRTILFDEVTLANTQAVNFGNAVKLLDVDLPTEAIPADGTIDVTLAWQALPPVTDEYSVSVQMLGENGRRVAQSDSFHPAGLPLPRWQAGEYGFDVHRLTPLPATSPGKYELVVFVYNLASGQRLNTLNEVGQPMGNEFSVGHITLASPIQFPESGDLAVQRTKTEGGGEAPFLAENVQLLGYDAPLGTTEVGQIVPLTLYWYTPQVPVHDFTAEIWIGCENDVTAVSLPPDFAHTPNTSWQAGQIQRAEFDVPLLPIDEAGNTLEPGLCTLYLGLSAAEEKKSLALETFAISVPKRNYTLPETAVSHTESFANLVNLAGFTLDQTSFTPGETIPLTLYWQPESLINTSYKVFVQLLDENGRLITQQDQVPANGTRPTTGWIPGEFVEDDYTLLLPPDVSPGSHQLITGLYDAETGQRLLLADGPGDAITLPVSIEVKTAE